MLRYAITDRRRLAPDEDMRQSLLCRLAERWGRAGIEFVQLREKDLTAGELANLVRKVRSAIEISCAEASHRPRLLVNTRADVAIAAGADGVHLTSAQGSLTPAQVRRLYASAGLPDPVVSVSCHSLAEVAAAREAGASLILFGPVFEKVAGDPETPDYVDSLVSDGTGLGLLRSACSLAAPIPIFALGGVTQANAELCQSAGAAGIAGIRLFVG